MVGFVGVGASPPHRFDDEDAEALTVLARHAAIAIENAHRYGEEQRRTERLARIARVGHTIAAGSWSTTRAATRATCARPETAVVIKTEEILLAGVTERLA